MKTAYSNSLITAVELYEKKTVTLSNLYANQCKVVCSNFLKYSYFLRLRRGKYPKIQGLER